MPENHTLVSSTESGEETNLLDVLIILAKYKKLIAGVVFVTALATAGLSLLKPDIYTGTARILPPKQDTFSAGALLSQLGGVGGLAGGAISLKSQNDRYIAMLNSRNIMEKIVQRFNLQTVYHTSTMTDTLHQLGGASSITSGRDDIITVAVDDVDPQRAANIANAYIEELDKFVQGLGMTEAASRRQFLEDQLKSVKDKLTDAEILLDKTPSTSLQYMDAFREVRYQEGVYQILARQFEAAKLDEAKNIPLIQVLDKATAPERKSKPHRTLNVIWSALAAFLLSAIWAFVRESFLRAKQSPHHAARIGKLLEAMKFRA